MNTICGANCDSCFFKDDCMGCAATCGKPFGGTCIAAEYIKAGGAEKYHEFKRILLAEVNALLQANGIPVADRLNELPGSYVNLPYPLPNGGAVRMLDDRNIYLGTQIDSADVGICFGVVAGMGFILICSYEADGKNPELIIYKKR